MDNLNSNLNYFPFLLLLIFTKKTRKIRNVIVLEKLSTVHCSGAYKTILRSTCIDLKLSNSVQKKEWKVEKGLTLIWIGIKSNRASSLSKQRPWFTYCRFSFACLVSHEESIQVKSGLQPFQTEAAIHRFTIAIFLEKGTPFNVYYFQGS